MGYLGNNLSTVICGIFAAVLTGLWYVMTPIYPVLDIVFLMAVPIMWFLTFMCWIVQKGQDYSDHAMGSHKSPYTAEGKIVKK